MAKGSRKVVVRITSDTRGLVAGITKADLTLGNFAKTARAGVNVLGKALATSSAAAATGLAAVYARTAPLIDQQSKMAQRLGLTNEALAGLRHAAGLTGVGVASLDMGMQRMTRRVAEAAQGLGEAKGALKELNLDAVELAKLSPDEQFSAISDALNKIPDQAERIRLGFKLFDSEGVALVNTARLGSEGLRKMQEEAIGLGTALSDVDAAKVEASQDALSRAGGAAQGLMNRITVQLAPAVEAIGNLFFDAAKDSEGFKDEVAAGFEFLVRAAKIAVNALHGLKVIFKGLELAAAAFNAIVITVFEKVNVAILEVYKKGVEVINNLINAANMVPGIDIPLISTTGIESAQTFLTNLGASARENVGIVKDELHKLLMEPLPGDALEERIREIYANAAAAAAETVAARAPGAGGGEEGGEGGMSPADQARMEAFRQSLLTEEELERESHAKRLEEFALFSETLFESEAERRAALEQIEREHQHKLNAIYQAGLTAREKFNRMSWDNQVSTVAGALVDMTAGVATHSRKMFELNKAAGIASAIISAYQGIATTMAIYPYPFSIAMAALQGAAAFAQVRAIKNQSFGGGGGAPSQAAQVSTPVHMAGGGKSGEGGGGEGARRLDINLMGGTTLTREFARSILEQAGELMGDGYKLNFRSS